MAIRALVSTSVLKYWADSFDNSSMVLLDLSSQTTDEDRDSAPIDLEHTPIDMEQSNRIMGQLFTEIEHLRRERDCLRSALADAGFSLRVETIARCAHQAS